MCFYNYGNETWEVKKGDRVGQAMFTKFLITDDDEAEGTRQGRVAEAQMLKEIWKDIKRL